MHNAVLWVVIFVVAVYHRKVAKRMSANADRYQNRLSCGVRRYDQLPWQIGGMVLLGLTREEPLYQ